MSITYSRHRHLKKNRNTLIIICRKARLLPHSLNFCRVLLHSCMSSLGETMVTGGEHRLWPYINWDSWLCYLLAMRLWESYLVHRNLNLLKYKMRIIMELRVVLRIKWANIDKSHICIWHSNKKHILSSNARDRAHKKMPFLSHSCPRHKENSEMTHPR